MSNKLAPFYIKHRQHRALVKNMKSFCRQHPSRIGIGMGDGQHYSLEVLDVPAEQSEDGTLTPRKQTEIIEDLIRHIHSQGGSILSTQFASFWAKHPGHQRVTQSMTMWTLIERHPRRLSIVNVDGPVYRIEVLDAPSELREGQDHSPLQQRNETLQDLIDFIQERGGTVGLEMLDAFRGGFDDNLEAYLCENPETFMAVPSSDGGAMVSLPPHVSRAKPSGRWSKAHGSQAMSKVQQHQDLEGAEDSSACFQAVGVRVCLRCDLAPVALFPFYIYFLFVFLDIT